MQYSLLNLISTPVPVLNTVGLNLRVGLSSEDPMPNRHSSEDYEVYLSIYSPEGTLLDRPHLGHISPRRRKYFNVTEITRKLVPHLDHLTVVHRIPSRLLTSGSKVDDHIELPEEPDYSYVRSLVEYSYPEGGNGSVIYETPPRLNTNLSSNTLTFTNQIVLSENMNTSLVLINHSVNPQYSRIADYNYGVYSLSGEKLIANTSKVGPFGITVLDMSKVIPSEIIQKETDPQDGLATFTFVGISENAAMLVVVINSAPRLGAVSVEHTHPPQTYLLPSNSNMQRRLKTAAQAGWKKVLSQKSGS